MKVLASVLIALSTVTMLPVSPALAEQEVDKQQQVNPAVLQPGAQSNQEAVVDTMNAVSANFPASPNPSKSPKPNPAATPQPNPSPEASPLPDENTLDDEVLLWTTKDKLSIGVSIKPGQGVSIGYEESVTKNYISYELNLKNKRIRVVRKKYAWHPKDMTSTSLSVGDGEKYLSALKTINDALSKAAAERQLIIKVEEAFAPKVFRFADKDYRTIPEDKWTEKMRQNAKTWVENQRIEDQKFLEYSKKIADDIAKRVSTIYNAAKSIVDRSKP